MPECCRKYREEKLRKKSHIGACYAYRLGSEFSPYCQSWHTGAFRRGSVPEFSTSKRPCSRHAVTRKPWGSTKVKSPSRCGRSEEHTSELQSLRHLVCRL